MAEFPPVLPGQRKKRLGAEQNSKCDLIAAILLFEKLRPGLIKDHYNWYLTIEPETGEYFLNRNHLSNLKKARQKYPNSIFCTFCINGTGACGKV